MSLFRLNNLTMSYDGRAVLRGVFFRLQAGERIGLIGKNGTGKTTVLKLILGQLEPTEGSMDITPGVKIGYFSQFSELDSTLSAQQVLEALFAEVRAIQAELDAIGMALETVEDEDEMTRLLDRQAFLLDEMARRDGWEYARHIDTVLTKLGFSDRRRAQPIHELSGGWRNRAALAQILLEAPDVLLLDEPTNYLDVEGLAWLENWLNTFRGGLLLVSHDRQFLDGVVNRIVEVENHQFQEYAGCFTDYIREKQFRFKTLARQWQHEEELLVLESEAIGDRVEARRNPDPAVRRKLADLKKQREPRPIDTVVTALYQGLHIPDSLCHVEELGKAYGDQALFEGLTFDVAREDRLAIVGPNGSGKSTLLRLLRGDEIPDAGTISWPGGVSFADFNQIYAELDLKDTVSHNVNTAGGPGSLAFRAPRKQVHKFLELLQFSEMDLNQRLGDLSGGQRARVALAKCLLSEAAVLILDEPTNHLDLTSTQVMERALTHFPGAVIVVSHDRFFLDKVASRLLVFEPGGKIRQINGNWTTWQATLDT